jgi:LacI family transcriptional regulator
MQKKVRIKDIAQKAGVSTGTVDRVLHSRGYVSEKAKQKVLDTLEEIGYERNLLASTLAYNRNHRIVALLPDYHIDPYWEQPFTGSQQAISALQHYGIQVEYIHFKLFDPEDFVKKAEQVLQRPPDGLLFPPLFLKEGKWLIDECEKEGIPAVIINTQIEGANVLSYIGQDSYQSGILAARLLDFALQGTETVMVLNLEKSITNAIHILEKERGFRDYFTQHQKQDIKVVRYDFDNFGEKMLLKQFIKAQLAVQPDLAGVFVTNSRAYQLVECLPADANRQIKIVGFDLVLPNIHYLNTGKINFLVNQNSVEQGYLGVVTLFNYLFLKEIPERNQYLPLDIVVAENVQYYLKKQQVLHTL